LHADEQAVIFAQNIVKAGNYFLDNPMETPFHPSWNRGVQRRTKLARRHEAAMWPRQ